MPVIDADTHVFECDDTFAFMQDALAPLKGEAVRRNGERSTYWLLGGQQFNRTELPTDDIWKVMSELLDVDTRVRAMDDMGVDVQVIYPTFFLRSVASEVHELEVTRSYNRWMADRCGRSGGRLRWIAIPPYQNIDCAREELRFAKDNGAVGVLKKGDREAGYWPCQEYFYPLYAEAERLNLPICFHVGTGSTEALSADLMPHIAQHIMHMSNVSAFVSVITFQMAQKFPGLRWGFIELSASWVPYSLYYMRRILAKKNDVPNFASKVAGSETFEVPADVLARNNIYVACFVDEDFPNVIKHTGEDNLLIGSDFVHKDHSTELDFVGALNARVAQGDLSAVAVRKMTYDNPRAFYAL
jgi:predicted TIM-barrel fold metal-dependent hydrolase